MDIISASVVALVFIMTTYLIYIKYIFYFTCSLVGGGGGGGVCAYPGCQRFYRARGDNEGHARTRGGKIAPPTFTDSRPCVPPIVPIEEPR